MSDRGNCIFLYQALAVNLSTLIGIDILLDTIHIPKQFYFSIKTCFARSFLMAGKGRKPSLTSIDDQIQKQQDKIQKIQERLDAAHVVLKGLIQKRDSLKFDDIKAAMIKSNVSAEEVLNFIMKNSQN